MKRQPFGRVTPAVGLRLIVIAAFVLTPACAYNYAGSEGKVQKDPRPRQSVEVVKLKEAEESKEPDKDQPPDDAPAPTTTADADSPCGVEHFTVFEFSSTREVQTVVDCESKRVVSRDESRIAGTPFARRRARGLPKDQAYILVDPYGKTDGILTNDHLLKLSREFEIEFYTKTQDGLLIYLFHEDTSAGAPSSRRSSEIDPRSPET